jgi:hypothetical protein
MQALEPLLEKLEPDSWVCFNKYVKASIVLRFIPLMLQIVKHLKC